MSASHVRLVVLATVMHLEPATGYAVRKHLLDQGLEAWGGTSVASTYSVLRTLTRHGHLEELDDPTGTRRNTKAYRLTPAGRSEFLVLWDHAIATVDPARPVGFHVAATLTALVTKQRYVDGLRRRIAAFEASPALPPGAPPQVANAARLWMRLGDAELTWLRETVELVERSDPDFGFLPE